MKKTITDLLKQSKDVKIIKDINGNLDKPIAGTKWKIETEGEFVDMSNNKGFTKVQIEQLQALFQPINQRLENIENRLDIVEKDVKDIKSRLDNVEKDIKEMKNTPTMKRELNN